MKPLLLAALLLTATTATTQDAREADPTLRAMATAQQAHAARLADALDRHGGARERALAALLREASRPPDAAGDGPSRPSPDAQADAVLRRALAGAGDDVLALQWLAAAAADRPELQREAARRWREADPGNLVPLLQAGLPVDALLAQARATTRADARMYEGVRWIASAHGRHPPAANERSALAPGTAFDPAVYAAMAASGLWTLAVMPAYGSLVEACRGQALRAAPARRGECAHVAGLLVDHADTAAGQLAGLAILEAIAATQADRAELARRQRAIDWRMLEWGRLAAAQDDHGMAQFVRLLADPSIRSEQQLAERVLAEAGVPLDPPAGWNPPRRR